MLGITNTVKKIAVGISGGVDSAVAALILKNKGYDITGVFMHNWDILDSEDSLCTSNNDAKDALWVCNKLNIPFKEVSFVREYWNHVFQEMVKDYAAGLNPNPDILCNSFIKFDTFYNYCRDTLNTDAIAMGHYVRTSFGPFLEDFSNNNSVKLLSGVDTIKDQSFFLSRVSQSALQRCIFPLGLLTKDEVKNIAREHRLDKVLQKKESMGICFVGSKNFKKFISEYVPDKNGDVIELDSGKFVRTHKGIHYWTIGQNCIVNDKPLKSYYVTSKDIKNNTIFVVDGNDHPALYSHCFVVSDMHWIEKEPHDITTNKLLRCQFRYTHGKPLSDCGLLQLPNSTYLVDLIEPAHAVAPGQFAVFYNGDECLGCGKIIQIGYTSFDLNYSEIMNTAEWELGDEEEEEEVGKGKRKRKRKQTEKEEKGD